MSTRLDLENPTSLAGHWAAEGAACRAAFAVRDKLVTTVHGSMPVIGGGAVVTAEGELSGAWLELDVAGIATGNARRDHDVHKPAFLDLAEHPIVRVELERATATSHGWTGDAVVQARGQQAPVDLTVAVLERGAGQVRARVTGRLDRGPLRMKVPTLVVARFLDLDVEVTFRRVDRQ